MKNATTTMVLSPDEALNASVSADLVAHASTHDRIAACRAMTSRLPEIGKVKLTFEDAKPVQRQLRPDPIIARWGRHDRGLGRREAIRTSRVLVGA